MITAINYNWFFSPAENSMGFENRTVGVMYGGLVCTGIEQHRAAGEGDKWYYDIHYIGGTTTRVFNPNEVFFKLNRDD